MINKKLSPIVWVMLVLIEPALAVEILAVESAPTKPLVGYKPTFKKFELNNTAPKAGDTLSVITEYNDEDGDKEVSPSFDWYIGDIKVDGQYGKAYTLPITSGGKDVTVKAKPKSDDSAYPALGDEYVTQPVTITAVPIVENLYIAGIMQAGGGVACKYTYNANGGSGKKSIRYQYGSKGTTGTLSNPTETTELELNPYVIKGDDIGKSLECSLQAINLDGVAGPVTTHVFHPVPDSSPEKGSVKIVYDNPSTIALNSEDGHPVVNVSTMKAEYKVKEGISSSSRYFNFDWKVEGVSVQKGIGLDTYKAPVDKQGKTVTVDVTPVE